jgi:acyl-CoA reductase-like NAD-dependent aldehyde dehydrogenase
MLTVRMRTAQAAWADWPPAWRLCIIRRLRHRLAATPQRLVAAVSKARARDAAEVLTSEIIPLADACRFLEREARRQLAPQRLGRRGRPVWLNGVRLDIRREPCGLGLIVAPANYPLFLPGVQMLQALAAGNAVLVKPAPGCAQPLIEFAAMLAHAGLPSNLCQIIAEDAASVVAASAAGIDKVVFTGSSATGRALLAELAPRLIPATLELSGNDAVFVLPEADLDQTAAALAFGLRLNGGQTCVAPRRVFVPEGQIDALADRLVPRVAAMPPVALAAPVAARVKALLNDARRRGARLPIESDAASDAPLRPTVVLDATPDMALAGADIMAPVLMLIPVTDMDAALTLDARCPYALGAAIFGPERQAQALAARVRAGAVVINDLIVPTADPRLPFGGRGESGYGVTRGNAGLLEWTTVKAISLRRGPFRPHYNLSQAGDSALFTAWLECAHGKRATSRLAALARLLNCLINQSVTLVTWHRRSRRSANDRHPDTISRRTDRTL